MGLPRTMLNLEGRLFYNLMSFSCAMAFLIFGYDAGVLGGVQTTQPFLDALKITGKETNGMIIPMIASSYTLGCLFMSVFLIFSNVGFHFGRRACIMMGDVLVMVGGILQSTSYSVAQICTARVIVGFGIGMISATVPTYMAETTIKVQERGKQGAIQCMYLIWGVAFAYWVDLGMTQLKYQQVSWRFPIGLMSFFTFVSFVIMLVLPDTPRWYYCRGRIEDGDRVLSALYAKPITDEEVQHTKNEILETLQLEADQGTIEWRDWIWDRSPIQAARRVKTSFMLLALHQFMGINLCVYYATVILSQVGLDPLMQSTIAGVSNTIFFLGTVATYFTIERWGRRPLMIWTAVGCVIVIAVYIGMNAIEHKTRATQWTAIVMVILFEFLIGWGWMGPAWLYGPEIAPLRYRHLAGAAGIFGEWLCCFIIVFGGGTALSKVGWPIWFWQLATCVITAIYTYYWCPETAGLTLEQIDAVFIEDAKKWIGPKVREIDETATRRYSLQIEGNRRPSVCSMKNDSSTSQVENITVIGKSEKV